MKRISLLALICAILVINSTRANPIHPAVQMELQKCLAHGMVLARAINEEIQDAREIRETGSNAYYASQLAKSEDDKKTAAKEEARFFAALKKQHTKVSNPEIVENFTKAVMQALMVYIATLSATPRQNPDMVMIQGVPVNPLFLKN